MGNQQIRYGIGFDVDNSGLQKARQELRDIEQMTLKDFKLIKAEGTIQELNEIKQSAKSLQDALEDSFNPKLGTVNVEKFSQSLKNIDIKRVETQFAQLGAKGSSAFRNMTAEILTTQREVKQTSNLIDSMAKTLGNTIKWSIASSAINTVTGKIQEAWGFTKKLDASLNDIRIVTGKSADEMERFAKQSNKAAKDLGAATTNYTNAALIYYQQGLDEKDVEARSNVTVKAANVTGQSASEVSEQLTAVWNGYKVVAEEAELYVDKLAAVAATTAADLEELSTGMSKVASAAHTMGVDVDQLSAQLATIISVTRQDANVVGTALKTIYARMGDLKVDGVDEFGTSLGDVSSQMQQMGINVLDETGNLRDMGDVIEEVAAKWGSWTDAQQQAAAVAIAGKRQYNNLIALFENWDMYESSKSTSSGAAGTLQKQQDIYMDSLAARLQRLGTAGERVFDAIFDSESMKDFIDGLTVAVDRLAEFIESIGGGGNLLLGFGSIAMRVFSGQIAGGISRTITNLGIMKKAILQNQAELEIQDQYQGASDEAIKKMVALKEQELKHSKLLTDEQKAQFEWYIKQTAELQNQLDLAKEQQESAEEYAQKRLKVKKVDVAATRSSTKKVVQEDGSVIEEKTITGKRAAKDLEKHAEDLELESSQLKFDKNYESAAKSSAAKINKEKEKVQQIEEFNIQTFNLDPSLAEQDIEALKEKQKEISKILFEQIQGQLQQTGEDLVLEDGTTYNVESFSQQIIKDPMASTMEFEGKEGSEELGQLQGIQEIIQARIQLIATENAEKQKLQETENSLKDTVQEAIDTDKVNTDGKNELIDALKEYNENLALARKNGNKQSDITNAQIKLQNRYQKALKNTAKEEKEVADVLKQGTKPVEDANKKVADLEKTTKDFLKNINTTAAIEGITKTVSAIGSLATAWKSFKNIGNIWDDDSLSQGEKLAETFSAIVSSVGMVTLAYKSAKNGILEFVTAVGLQNTTLGAAITLGGTKNAQDAKAAALTLAQVFGLKLAEEELKDKNAEEIKSLLLEKIKNKTKEKGIKLTWLQIAANWALRHSFLAITLIVTAIVAVVALLTIGVASLIKTFQNADDNGRKAFENASKAAQQAAEEFNRVKEAYDNLKKSLEDYNAAQKAIEKLTVGTQEWKDAIMEANMQVLELIDKYPELAKYVSNVDGQLKISQAGQDAILKVQYEQTQFAAAANLNAKANQLNAKNNTIIQTASGEQLETIWSGWLGDKINKNITDDAYTDAIEVINDKGNAILEDEDTFIETMQAETNINQKLIEQLWDARLELAKNAAEVAANTTAMTALREQAAASYLEGKSEVYQDSENKEALSAIASKIAQDRIDEKKKEILANANVSSQKEENLNTKDEIKLLAEQYKKAGILDFDVMDTEIDKEGKSVTFKSADGEEVVLSTDYMLNRLAQEAAYKDIDETELKKIEDSLNAIIQNVSNNFGEGLGEAFGTAIAGKTADFTSASQNEINTLQTAFSSQTNLMSFINKMGGILKVEELAKTLGYDGATDYLLALKEGLENYQKELEKLSTTLSASVQKSFNDLSTHLSNFSLNTQKSIANALTSAFEKGGRQGLDAITSLIASGNFSETELNKISDIVGKIDWRAGDDAINDLKYQLDVAGISINENKEYWNNLVAAMEASESVISNVTNNLSRLRNELAELKEITKELSLGDIISEEDYQKLIKQDKEFEKYFVAGASGRYYLGGADDLIKRTRTEKINIGDLATEFTEAVADTANVIEEGSLETTAEEVVRYNARDNTFDTITIIKKDSPFLTTDENTGEISITKGEEDDFTNAMLKDEYDFLFKASGINQDNYKENQNVLRGITTSSFKEFSRRSLKNIASYESADEFIKAVYGDTATDEQKEIAKNAYQEAIDKVASAETFIENSNDILIESLNTLSKGELTDELRDSISTSLLESESYDELKQWKDELTSIGQEELYNDIATTYLAIEADQLGINSELWENYVNSINGALDKQNEFLQIVKQKALYEEVDAYAALDRSIDEVANSLDQLNNERQREFGSGVIDNLNQQIQKEEELAKLQSKKYEQTKAEIEAIDKPILEMANATLDDYDISIQYDEDGTVSDATYAAIFEAAKNSDDPTVLQGILTDINAYNNKVIENQETYDQAMQDKVNNILDHQIEQNKYLYEIKNSFYDLSKQINDLNRTFGKWDGTLKSAFEEESVGDIIANAERNFNLLYDQYINTITPQMIDLMASMVTNVDDYNALRDKVGFAEGYDQEALQAEVDRYNASAKFYLDRYSDSVSINKDPVFKMKDENGNIVTPSKNMGIPTIEAIDAIEQSGISQSKLNTAKILTAATLGEAEEIVKEIKSDADAAIATAEDKKEQARNRVEMAEAEKQQGIIANDTYNEIVKMSNDTTEIADATIETANSVKESAIDALEIRQFLTINDNNPYVYIDPETGKATIDKNAVFEGNEELFADAFSLLEEMQAELEKMFEAFFTAQEQIVNLYDKEINKLSTINSVLQTSADIWKLIGKNSKGSSAILKNYYGEMTANTNRSYELALMKLKEVQEEYDKVMALGDEATQEMINSVTDALAAATEALATAARERLDAVIEEFNVKLDAAIDDFLEKSTGLDLTGVTEAWEQATKADEDFLDEVNSTYAIEELERKIQKSIDETDSVSAQKKLNAVMQEQLQILREKDKLSQYDVDRANALYELTLKQIALDEAQRTMSKMKLTRDAMGNYTYQYVADGDAIADAEAELAAAQNDVYNLDKDRAKSLADEYYSAMAEAKDKINEAFAEGDMERADRLSEYYFGSNGLLAQIQSELGIAQDNLNNMGTSIIGSTFDSSLEDFFDSIGNQNLGGLSSSIKSAVSSSKMEWQSASAALESLLSEGSPLVQALKDLEGSLKTDAELETEVDKLHKNTTDLINKLTGDDGMIKKVADLAKLLEDYAEDYKDWLKNQTPDIENNTKAMYGLTEAVLQLTDYMTDHKINGQDATGAALTTGTGITTWDEKTQSWISNATQSIQ